jgi:peroxiredoxin
MKITGILLLTLFSHLFLQSEICAQGLKNYTLSNTDGEEIQLSEILGEKLTVLDFWATWCKPCMKAIPGLIKLSDEFKDMKTKTIIISAITLINSLFYSMALGQNVGDNAPDFTLSTVSGSSFTLSENTGKVVFLFLFGYGCPHCLANGNNTETGIYSEFKNNENFVALGIDTWDGNQSSVENFISQTGITYPVAMDGSSVQSAYSTTYDRIIVVDQGGVIRYKATANATSSVVNEAKAVINNLFTTTSIANPVENSEDFKVFPVPAKETLYIENSTANLKNATFNIVNLNGSLAKQITSANDENGKLKIPVNSLISGVYILQMITRGQVHSKKIIIE